VRRELRLLHRLTDSDSDSQELSDESADEERLSSDENDDKSVSNVDADMASQQLGLLSVYKGTGLRR